MPLASGTRLGSYEVLSPLGSGGMGDVYRTRDTKLHREVAIKVLPEGVAPSPERIARFEREAHLLASLNHPNIATIHGLEVVDGLEFLVLELVEGETLADRIARGRLSFEQARPLFEQVARGLEAAHDKGIIHRDLKPSNIQITPNGQVKILDFGLAKVFEESEPALIDVSKSPTLTREGTRTGVILGTAAYMSPEQARGDAVDKRTDIWAFGCCLYEALTGKPAFRGATVTDILAAVVRAEPDWQRLPRDIPPSVRRLLRRSLQKEADDRLQHIGDARLELREGLSEPDLPVVGSLRSPGNRAKWIWAAVVAVILFWGLWAFLTGARAIPSSQSVRFTVSLPDSVRLATPESVAISPEGDQIVFVGSEAGETRLFFRSLDDWHVVALPETDGAVDAFFSPDSEWVGFATRFSAMKKVSLTGGRPLLLCAACSRGRLGSTSWSSTGAMVFTAAQGGPGSDFGSWSRHPGDAGTTRARQ